MVTGYTLILKEMGEVAFHRLSSESLSKIG